MKPRWGNQGHWDSPSGEVATTSPWLTLTAESDILDHRIEWGPFKAMPRCSGSPFAAVEKTVPRAFGRTWRTVRPAPRAVVGAPPVQLTRATATSPMARTVPRCRCKAVPVTVHGPFHRRAAQD